MAEELPRRSHWAFEENELLFEIVDLCVCVDVCRIL